MKLRGPEAEPEVPVSGLDSLDETQESEPPGHQWLEARSRVDWALTSVRSQECFLEAETPPAVKTGTKVILGDNSTHGRAPKKKPVIYSQPGARRRCPRSEQGCGCPPNGEDGSKEMIEVSHLGQSF